MSRSPLASLSCRSAVNTLSCRSALNSTSSNYSVFSLPDESEPLVISMSLAHLQHTITIHTSDVNSVAFSSTMLATCAGDKTVRLWNLDDFSELPCSPLLGHPYSVQCCVFSPDEAWLASSSIDGKVILWGMKNGQKLAVLETMTKGIIKVCRFSSNSRMLVTGSSDEMVCLWDLALKKLMMTYSGHESTINCVAFSPDNQFIVSGSSNGDIAVWDAKYGHSKFLVFEDDTHDLGVMSCDFSPTYGSAAVGIVVEEVTQIHFLLATAGMDNSIKLWDLITYAGNTGVRLQLRDTLSGHSGPIIAISFSPNGKIIASASNDKSVRLWDPAKAECTQTIEAHERYVTCCGFSKDSLTLATGSNDKLVHIWRLTSDDEILDDEVLIDIVPQQHDAAHMTVDDVCDWLADLGLKEHVDMFRKNAIDGHEVLTLTHAMLENDLKIDALGHRKKKKVPTATLR